VEKIFAFSQKYPLVVILLLAAGCILAGLNVGKLYIDSSPESMMMKGDPARNFYQDTLERFGSDSMMMIYVEDEELFTVKKLDTLEDLVIDLGDRKRFPGIARVESIYSAGNIAGYPDYLDNSPLMDQPPKTDEEAQIIREKALKNPILVDSLISRNGLATVINLYLVPNTGKSEVSETVRQIKVLLHNKNTGYDRYYSNLFEIGGPYLSEEITNIIMKDMATLLPIAMVVLLIMLVISMGSFNGAVLPFITSALSIFYTLGFMGATNLPFNLLTFIIPILVIVIGSTEDVHILSEYMEGVKHTGTKKMAIAFVARAVGTAIFLTSLTTFLGFLSISINKITVLIQFGLVAGFAMLINPVTTCLVSPLYLKYLGSTSTKVSKKKNRLISHFISMIANMVISLITRHKKKVLLGLLGFAVVLGCFTVFIRVDNDTVGYFKKDSAITRRLNIMHKELAGAQTFFVRIKRRSLQEITSDSNPSAAPFSPDEPTPKADPLALVEGGDQTIDIFEKKETAASADLSEEIDIFADAALKSVSASDSAEDTLTDDKLSSKHLFHDPRYLRMIDDIQTVFKNEFEFDNTISIADYIKLLHKEMNVGQPGNYNLTPDPSDPQSKSLIAQYALTLHAEEVSSYITSDWSEANILVRHNINSSNKMKEVVQRAESRIAAILQDVDPLLEFGITGENILINRAADSITSSQIVGFSILLFTIFIIMSLLFMNIKAGLLSLIPNLFPVAIMFGVMGIFKIPLNLGTCMVAAIAIGISIDDTIHFMTRFNKEMSSRQNRNQAVEAVIKLEIRPIFSTSLALMLGFLILTLANLMPLVYFGLLSTIVMLFALIADLLLTPILLSSVQLVNVADLAAITLASELQSAPLFYGMSMLEIKKLTLLGKVIACKEGDYLIRAGDQGNQIFILLSGSATVKREDQKEGKVLYISKLFPGALIGEISLLRDVTRTASVTAEQDSSFLEINWASLVRLQKSAKRISIKLFKNMARILGKRLVEMTDKVQELQNERSTI
jgi:predicted RND superfamily exporter protein